MIKVYIPHYLAEEIRKRFGSLENYSKQRWGGRLMPVDDYWDRWEQGAQDSINEELSQQWNLVSQPPALHQERMQTPHA